MPWRLSVTSPSGSFTWAQLKLHNYTTNNSTTSANSAQVMSLRGHLQNSNHQQPGGRSSLTAWPMGIRSLQQFAHVHAHAHAFSFTLPDPAFSTLVAEPPQALSVVDAASFLLPLLFLHVNPQLTQE